jgi:hypothetical protein
MAKKETGEDILRTILEKGGMNRISSSSIQNAIQDVGGTLRGSISTPLTQSGLIPPPPITAEGSGASKKSEALLENQKKTLEDIKKNTGNTAKMIDSLIKIQKTYNDDSKSLIKSLLESNEAQRIAVEENNRSKEAGQEKVAGAITASINKSNNDTSKGQEKSGGGFLDKITTAAAEMFGIKKTADVASGGKNATGTLSNAKPGPSIGSRLLRGGLVGGGAMAAYSLLGPNQQKALGDVGVDQEAVGVLGTAAGVGGPAGVLMAAGYGLLKLIEKAGKTLEGEKQTSAVMKGAGNPDAALAEEIRNGTKPYATGATPEETEANRQAYESRLNRERMDLENAPAATKYYGLDREKYLDTKQNEREQQFFNRRTNAGNLQAANEGVTVSEEITPSTETISQQKANEIYGDSNPGNVGFWKNTDQRRRAKLLQDAQKRGVVGINPNPEKGSSAPAVTVKPMPDNYSYEVATTQDRFNKITEEVMSTKPQSSAPVIINGGSTINNITTTSSGGGRGGGGGSPSRATNPWDSTLFGEPWKPYY